MKVIDASAVSAVLFGEPEGHLIADRLGEELLAAPTLLAYEVANTCWKKLRRDPELRTELLAAYARLPRLGLRHLRVELPEVMRLAEKTGLTVYDASYLWLARALDVELISLDTQVLQAAAKI
ncbi:MAG TPA: type II toxin-antitoxin system VapC family toxin [Thermoanaerobaculia bacterium]|nr:type II toxin-antitoxin system VapC family toxin [Thermoanaerobaculia bacterium]